MVHTGFDFSMVIGGDAGQGVETSGSLFSLALARAGLHVFSHTDYRSRIRGGHNFYQIRVSSSPIQSHHDPVSLVVALTKETVSIHRANMAPGCGVIFDTNTKMDTHGWPEQQVIPLGVPLTEIAEACGSKVMLNTAAQAAAAAVLGLPLEFLRLVLHDRYRRKGEKVLQGNLAAAEQAYAYATNNWGTSFSVRLQPDPTAGKRILMNGNEAFALGAAVGGCRFIAAYPMTPATTIFEWFIAHAHQLGIVAKQAEDEIAAALMALGASYAGARAMSSTSGGGFNLMTETIGMAAMCEIPLVLVDVQRGGPSTGLPTRTEQSDLMFVLHPSHGEFPHIVLAPGTVEECFTIGWRAFNLAERYQCPVIVLSDTYLSSSLTTLEWEALNLADVHWDRGKLLTQLDLDQIDDYQRFAFTADNISPRAVPGQRGAVHAPSTDEHTEDGHISEAIDNRIGMMNKRMHKLDAVTQEMSGPIVYGPDSADVSLLTWGSLKGPAEEATRILAEAGVSANVIHFRDLWPLPVQPTLDVLSRARRLMSVEQNYTGQLTQLIRMATGVDVPHMVTKFDGRPISPSQIAESVLSHLTPIMSGT